LFFAKIKGLKGQSFDVANPKKIRYSKKQQILDNL
jgi:hypothetical protein